jgi:osmotically-inducible protein OsmY
VALACGGLALAAAVGAGLMFLFDPASGGRRRARLRRSLTTARARGRGAVAGAAESAGERSRRFAAAVRARLRTRLAGERGLEERVRARLGRVASNPGAIAVTAEGNRVTLRGSVPPDEIDDVLDEVASVQGVREVYNLLQVWLAAPNLPGNH